MAANRPNTIDITASSKHYRDVAEVVKQVSLVDQLLKNKKRSDIQPPSVTQTSSSLFYTSQQPASIQPSVILGSETSTPKPGFGGSRN